MIGEVRLSRILHSFNNINLENYPKISPENKLTFFTASIKVQLIFL
jgi:hypothetical protein